MFVRESNKRAERIIDRGKTRHSMNRDKQKERMEKERRKREESSGE